MTEVSPGVEVTLAFGVKPVWAIVIPVVRLATGATRAATMKITRTATMTVPKMEPLVKRLKPGIEEGTRLLLRSTVKGPLKWACCRWLLDTIVHMVASNKLEVLYQGRRGYLKNSMNVSDCRVRHGSNQHGGICSGWSVSG